MLLCLVKAHAPYHVDLHALRLKKDKLLGMVKIGLPAGIQGCSFLHLQRAHPVLHQFLWRLGHGGNTAASNIEGFVSTAQDAFSQAALSFTARTWARARQNGSTVFLPLCAALVLGVGLALGSGAYLLGNQLLGIYSSDPEVIAFGMKRMAICCVLQCVGGLMAVMVARCGAWAIPLCHGHHHRLCVRFPGDMDFHHFRAVAHFGIPLCLLSHHLGPGRLVRLICFFFVRKHLTRKQRLARERAK